MKSYCEAYRKMDVRDFPTMQLQIQKSIRHFPLHLLVMFVV